MIGYVARAIRCQTKGSIILPYIYHISSFRDENRMDYLASSRRLLGMRHRHLREDRDIALGLFVKIDVSKICVVAIFRGSKK